MLGFYNILKENLKRNILLENPGTEKRNANVTYYCQCEIKKNVLWEDNLFQKCTHVTTKFLKYLRDEILYKNKIPS